MFFGQMLLGTILTIMGGFALGTYIYKTYYARSAIIVRCVSHNETRKETKNRAVKA